MTLEQLALDWSQLTLDQLVQYWETLTPEQRIEIGVTLAMAIVSPEEWKGYVFEPRRTWRTRWQHVDLCRAKIADALREVAAPPKLRHARGGGKELREGKPRKEAAAHLFGDIMFDFGGHLPMGCYMAEGENGMLSKLCTIAFAVATGRVGKGDLDALVRPAVLEYLNEIWTRDKGWRLKQPRGKDRKRSKAPPPSAALIEAINNPTGRQELEDLWNEPRPMPKGALN